jgi:glycosyltransferase involved in cell wall biosynthesis
MNEPYLLFVGLRSGYKNFEGFVEAFAVSKKLKDRFHVVCFGGGAFSTTEKDNFKELGVEKYVHQVSGNDKMLVNYYRNATAFVCPSLYEGFGIPILEAMGLSCPVVCASTSSIPEVAGDAAVYFDPNDISSIQSVLENTLFNKDLLTDLKKRGLQREANFSWDICADETLSLYRSLLN